MNAEEKRKVFEGLLEKYQDYLESEFSYEDGEREAERKAWLNKYDGIKEPLIKDEKVRKAVRASPNSVERKRMKIKVDKKEYEDLLKRVKYLEENRAEDWKRFMWLEEGLQKRMEDFFEYKCMTVILKRDKNEVVAEVRRAMDNLFKEEE